MGEEFRSFSTESADCSRCFGKADRPLSDRIRDIRELPDLDRVHLRLMETWNRDARMAAKDLFRPVGWYSLRGSNRRWSQPIVATLYLKGNRWSVRDDEAETTKVFDREEY